MREEGGRGLNYGQQVIFEYVFLQFNFSDCVDIFIKETAQDANLVFTTTHHIVIRCTVCNPNPTS